MECVKNSQQELGDWHMEKRSKKWKITSGSDEIMNEGKVEIHVVLKAISNTSPLVKPCEGPENRNDSFNLHCNNII